MATDAHSLMVGATFSHRRRNLTVRITEIRRDLDGNAEVFFSFRSDFVSDGFGSMSLDQAQRTFTKDRYELVGTYVVEVGHEEPTL